MVYGECNAISNFFGLRSLQKENVHYKNFVENLGTLLIVKKYLPI
jgi:hypothetical protein